MRSGYRQMSLPEIFAGVTEAIEEGKPELIGLPESAIQVYLPRISTDGSGPHLLLL